LGTTRGLETGFWKQGFGNRGLETGVWKQGFGNRGLETKPLRRCLNSETVMEKSDHFPPGLSLVDTLVESVLEKRAVDVA